MKALLLAIVLSATAVLHDYFVSICTIRHNAEEKTLRITWRMTTHDIEHVLLAESKGVNLKLGTDKEPAYADSLLGAYVTSHLRLEMDGKPLQLRYLGKEIELEDMYCFLQVDNVSELHPLTVFSSLLFDMFDEQQNVVHLETRSGTVSHDFRNSSEPFTLVPAP
ncbi:MAG: DUF6702 family protein [Flavobacteriales bacterium]